MTLPFERSNSVMRTRDFLLGLCSPRKTPRVPKRIREISASLLKHYPSSYDVQHAHTVNPEQWGPISLGSRLSGSKGSLLTSDESLTATFIQQPQKRKSRQFVSAIGELSALNCALSFALNAHSLEEVKAKIDQVINRVTTSMEKPHRSDGEDVELRGIAGFGGQAGIWRITSDAIERDLLSFCPLCGNFACREWPTLTLLDKDRNLTDTVCHHVSECEMF